MKTNLSSARRGSKRASELCVTPFCRHPAREKRTMCNSCRNRLYDKPMRRLFRNLKSHAKERGKEFTLTFDYFAALALINGYDVNHGRTGEKLSVDRIHAHIGYVVGNVAFLTVSENSKKRWTEYK